MKAYSIYTALFFNFILLLFSCKKSDLITYNGTRLLYFSIASADSVSVNFSRLPDEVKDTILAVPVGLLGFQLDGVTPFDISIDEQHTTASKGSDFELPAQFSFPAKKSTDTVRIKFTRTEKLATGEYVLALELKTTPQFNNTLFESNRAKSQARKIRIFLTDILQPTEGWANTPDRLGTEYYLGRFTRKKFQLLTALYKNWTFNELYDQIDTYPSFFGDILNAHLKAQRAAGVPVLEGDGTPMEVGVYYFK